MPADRRAAGLRRRSRRTARRWSSRSTTPRAARPQTGFNTADIVFEEIVNDSLTRFAAGVPQPGTATRSGPIRSGRMQDVDLFGSYTARCSCGAAATRPSTRAIGDSDFVDLNARRRRGCTTGAEPARRPHNLYGNTRRCSASAPAEQAGRRRRSSPTAGRRGAVGGTRRGHRRRCSTASRVRWDVGRRLPARTCARRTADPHLDAAHGRRSRTTTSSCWRCTYRAELVDAQPRGPDASATARRTC